MWRRGVRKCWSFRMCLSSYDYQSKASRYSYGLTYLKIRVITNQKHTIDSKKQKQKERNTSIIQKKTIKPQKENQKEERNKE